MKNGYTEHFWRIHARVARRILSDLPLHKQDAVATAGTDESEWFEQKSMQDAQRLYEDPNYYDNLEHTFRIPKHAAA